MTELHVHGTEHHVSRMKKYKSVLAISACFTVLMLYTGHAVYTTRQADAVAMEMGSMSLYTPGNVHSGSSGSGNVHSGSSVLPKIRIVCLILTMEKDINTKVAAVNKTWATRCDKHFYVVYSNIKRNDFLNIDIPDTRNNLIHKMQKAYETVYDKYINDFDFLLKADDDSYVIVENLKYLLSNYEGSKPGYLGFHFDKFVNQGYMSGGAGYVVSNQGLRDLVEKGYKQGLCEIKPREDDKENSEDIETGRCLEKAGVPVLSSLDEQGRETFHPYPLEKYLFGNVPAYVYSWAKHPVVTGDQCCGRYIISFHYVSTDAMLFMHHLLYKTSVFGVNTLIEGTHEANNDGVT